MKVKNIVISIIVAGMMAFMSMSAMAVERENIYLPEDQVWTNGQVMTRSLKDDEVYVRCDSVYPIEGKDNFSHIQVRLIDNYGRIMTDNSRYVLTEGNGYEKLIITNGYLTSTSVRLQFRGNTDEPAYAVVSYYIQTE